jgi:DNA-binding response OmpR family regulator
VSSPCCTASACTAGAELLRVVWGGGAPQGRPRQILDVYVCHIRRKLESLGIHNAISTVRRFGYALGGGAAR